MRIILRIRKAAITFSILAVLIVASVQPVYAADPPPPPGGTGSGSGGTPIGGGAPISGGIGILLALGIAYGGRKIYQMKLNEEVVD